MAIRTQRGFATPDPKQRRRKKADTSKRAPREGKRMKWKNIRAAWVKNDDSEERRRSSDGRSRGGFEGGRGTDSRSGGSSASRRGFAAMPREEVRRIGRMGGQASHGSGSGNNGGSKRFSSGSSSTRRRGFGAMSQEKVQRIARKGGRARAAGR